MKLGFHRCYLSISLYISVKTQQSLKIFIHKHSCKHKVRFKYSFQLSFKCRLSTSLYGCCSVQSKSKRAKSQTKPNAYFVNKPLFYSTRGGLGGRPGGTAPPRGSQGGQPAPSGILERKETNWTILILFIVNKKPDVTSYLNDLECIQNNSSHFNKRWNFNLKRE